MNEIESIHLINSFEWSYVGIITHFEIFIYIDKTEKIPLGER